MKSDRIQHFYMLITVLSYGTGLGPVGRKKSGDVLYLSPENSEHTLFSSTGLQSRLITQPPTDPEIYNPPYLSRLGTSIRIHWLVVPLYGWAF